MDEFQLKVRELETTLNKLIDLAEKHLDDPLIKAMPDRLVKESGIQNNLDNLKANRLKLQRAILELGLVTNETDTENKNSNS